jgi:glutamine synthetase
VQRIIHTGFSRLPAPLPKNTTAFFEPTADGGAIERFSGDALAQQEPDASSFPSGGIRNTFEARGYTAWDPSSPAFIIGRTLCIPTVFVSYTGEALDYKVPLLKALSALDKAAVDVCHYFDKSIEKVNASLGIEQEYFLVDIALFNARPDLFLTGPHTCLATCRPKTSSWKIIIWDRYQAAFMPLCRKWKPKPCNWAFH